MTVSSQLNIIELWWLQKCCLWLNLGNQLCDYPDLAPILGKNSVSPNDITAFWDKCRLNVDYYTLPFVSMDTYMYPEEMFYVTVIVQPRMERMVCWTAENYKDTTEDAYRMLNHTHFLITENLKHSSPHLSFLDTCFSHVIEQWDMCNPEFGFLLCMSSLIKCHKLPFIYGWFLYMNLLQVWWPSPVRSGKRIW